MKKKKNKIIIDIIKNERKIRREEEIALHTKPINHLKIKVSKKIYKRNKFKNQNPE